MVCSNNIIKQELLRLFEEGKSETEAFEELSKTNSSNPISLKAVSSWFTKFRSGEHSTSDKKKLGRPTKFTEDYLINLVKNNPGLNISELAKLANTSRATISNRLKQINTNDEGVSCIKRCTRSGPTEFTDEFLINLVNENPELNLGELAKLTYTSRYIISERLKQINSSEQRVNYIKKGPKSGAKKFTDGYLINLINDNPGLNMKELAELANTCISNISIRLKKINSNRSEDDKIVLKKNTSKAERKSRNTISNDLLIKLINENPELNIYELADLTDVSAQAIYLRLNKLDAEGLKANYIKKSKKNGVKKFTDEFIINLINEYPELNMTELSELTNTTQGTISNRLKQINTDNKGVSYIKKRMRNGLVFTDEYLIDLVNDNPELNTTELAKLAGISIKTISNALKRINKDGEKLTIVKKTGKKFTDEYLINLANENPELSMAQLAKLANTTTSTISRNLKRINADGEKLTIVKKGGEKFTDEFLINLINDNPTLNMVGLAKLANVTSKAISNRLKKINSNGERVKYTYKNSILC